MFTEDYTDYLRSEAWRQKRWAALKRAHFTCARCGVASTTRSRVELHVHHLTYDRLGDEFLNDLEVLCKACHENEHGRTFDE